MRTITVCGLAILSTLFAIAELSGDEATALAWVAKHGGKIARNETRSERPVVKVDLYRIGYSEVNDEGIKELARQTGLGEKSLHRMLNRNGNPTARNLGMIVRSIAEDLGIKPRVEVAAAR